MTFTIITLGCKVNQYDSGVIEKNMIKHGFTKSADDADIYIVNSCTVTENSDKKAFHSAARAKKENPSRIIVLTGCFPQAFPEKAAKLDFVDIVIGTAGKEQLPRLIADFIAQKRKITENTQHDPRYHEQSDFADDNKTRAYIKIEDGCDSYCSYCIIPTARGRVRSRSLENIREEARFQVNRGHREVVLVGINLSCYGKDIGLKLSDAVQAVAETEGVQRVRLSSLEPELLTEQEIERLADIGKLCPHFHLSLQSGCSQTLKRMNRHYSTDDYFALVQRLRMKFPNCAITTDIMVGFCGETDEEFSESLAFVDKIGFARAHVFTYSIREGTAAAKRTDHIDENVKAKRYKDMSALVKNTSRKFFLSQIGTVQKLLVERRTSPDFICGHTENYTPVRVYGGTAKRHDIIPVEITEVFDGFCVGICKST